VLASGAWAAASWWRTPAGRLAWDGAAWAFQGPADAAHAGQLTVALDLQRAVLVRWRGPRPHWFWLQRACEPPHWAALRRAVYSRPEDDAPSGAERPPDPP
jgi:hypothetical protein